MALKIIVGISGASGTEMGEFLLKELRKAGCESHLVITDSAKKTWELESGKKAEELRSLADYCYGESDFSASIASGSFQTDGMIIIPCSMKTLAGIVSGYADNLLLRSADVCLKEGRKVVLVPREMPLGRVHLRNLLQAAEDGCVIVPPVLTFYTDDRSLEGQMRHIIGKVLMQFGIVPEGFQPWTGKKGNTND